MPANGLIQSFQARDENGLAFGKNIDCKKTKTGMNAWMDGWMNGWMDKWGQRSQEPWVYSITEYGFAYFSRLLAHDNM